MLNFLRINYDLITIVVVLAIVIILPKITFGKGSLEKRRRRCR